jgi:hypothetical protein
MITQLFALVGVWALFRFMLAGPQQIERKKQEGEWDHRPVVASQIDHDIAVFAGPTSLHPEGIGAMRNLQEERNYARAQEARPLLDQFFITKDNNRKLELMIE